MKNSRPKTDLSSFLRERKSLMAKLVEGRKLTSYRSKLV